MNSQKLALLWLDLVLLIASYTFVYWARLGLPYRFFSEIPGISFLIGVLILCLYIFGAYELRFERKVSYFLRITAAVVIGSVVVLGVHYLLGRDRSGFFGRGIFLGGSGVFLVIACLLRHTIASIRERQLGRRRSIFILREEEIPAVASDLKNQNYHGQVLFINPLESSESELEYLSPANVLVVGIKELRSISNWGEQLVKAKFKGQTIFDLVAFYEMHWRKIPYFYIDDEWVVTSGGFAIIYSRIRLRIKRIFDLFTALFVLVLVWPLMLLTALAVRLESKGAILYRQTRTGLNGAPFTIFKFRSMTMDAEKNGVQWAKKNDARVTRVGTFIRKTRLDELPQLFNILRGEMSFVGPRPERPEFNVLLEKEIPFYDFRHLVPPGLTGWAQVNYPYGASVEDAKEKLAYELYYIKNHSLFLDIYILFKTIQTVLWGKGR